MQASVIVELKVPGQALPRLPGAAIIVQIYFFVLDRPPQALDQDVIPRSPLPVHADAYPSLLEQADPLRTGKLAALVAVANLRCSCLQHLPHRLQDEPQLQALDAAAETTPGTSLWLLTCKRLPAYVLYQPNYQRLVPIHLSTPLATVQADYFPFGKLTVRRDGEATLLELDAQFPPFGVLPLDLAMNIYEQRIGTIASDLWITELTREPHVILNGEEWPVEQMERDGQPGFRVRPYAKEQ